MFIKIGSVTAEILVTLSFCGLCYVEFELSCGWVGVVTIVIVKAYLLLLLKKNLFYCEIFFLNMNIRH